jgi:hypothetical protein
MIIARFSEHRFYGKQGRQEYRDTIKLVQVYSILDNKEPGEKQAVDQCQVPW